MLQTPGGSFLGWNIARFAGPVLLVLLAAWVFSFAGCQQDQITKHRIPRALSDVPHGQDHGGAHVDHTAHQPARMRVAIAALDQGTWFFRMTGDPDRVQAADQAWSEFLGSVRFEEGHPHWELPAGWVERPGDTFRFATLEVDSDPPPLEVAVSRLGPDQDLLANVNRWRGQLSLNELSQEQLDEHLTEITAADGTQLMVFDATGIGGAMDRAQRGMAMPATRDDATGADDLPEVYYTTPPGWTPGQTSSIVRGRLRVQQADGQAEFTVTVLPAAVNRWEPNVQRWATELNLPPLDAAEIEGATEQRQIAGMPAQLVRLDGPADVATARKSTVAAMSVRGGWAWFFKFFGDTAVIDDQQQALESLLDSVQFR